MTQSFYSIKASAHLIIMEFQVFVDLPAINFKQKHLADVLASVEDAHIGLLVVINV